MHKTRDLILLDTHIWMWFMSGVSKALSPPLQSLIKEMVPRSGLRVSPISVWEIGVLVGKKRIAFDCNVKDWVLRSLNAPGLEIAPISPEIAIESTLFPEGIHGDPADRILLATAIDIGATLVTHDKELLAYSKKHNFPVLSL